LAQRLIRDIAARGLKPGDRLGTEVEMVAQHNLSRATVRHALAVLEQRGYISRRRAQGTFVGKAVDPSAGAKLGRGAALIVFSNEQASHVHDDFAFAKVLRMTVRALARQGFTVQMLTVGENPEEDEGNLDRLLQQGQIAGICAIGSCFEPYRRLVPNIPSVASCTFVPLASPWVGQDIRGVSFDLVRYLVDRGHRDIALVCSAAIDQSAFAVFAKGYREAFAAAGLQVNRDLLYHAYANEPLQDLLAEILQKSNRPTAVFAENWRVCQAAEAAADRLGLRIPQDLSVVGYGLNALQLTAPVAITSWVPSAEGIGHEIARLLAGFTDGSPVPTSPTFVPGKLVEGESVQRIGTSER
jgi:DNA-binding LacI/PurR family transcriptional regulator